MPAYAISVHKSQGNEYPARDRAVADAALRAAPAQPALHRHHPRQKLVILIGSKKALAIAVRNNKTAARYSRLRERLRRGETNSH